MKAVIQEAFHDQVAKLIECAIKFGATSDQISQQLRELLQLLAEGNFEDKP